ncbi:VanZ family protein (plasmid) [Streptomyces jietaisiensis]|uniref:VanZ family protein n=1 Tax=Streptomyces griseoaurantiacus TaxID=68213 RepID=UPI002F9100D0
MFSAIFQHHVGYLAVCTLIGLVLGGAAGALARKRGNPHGAWWAALAFTLTGVLGVTFMGGGSASGVCVLNHQFAEPFHTTQGLWNLAMTVPVGAFALLAVRRPLPVLIGVLALPLAIEFTQATVDGLGRVCDTADAEMNIIGGLIGLTAVAVVLAVRLSLAWQAGVKGALITFVALVLLGSGVARPMLDFTNVDGSSLADASSGQKQAVEAAVKEAFGDHYRIGQLYEQPCGDSPCTNIIFNLHSREGGALRRLRHRQPFLAGQETPERTAGEQRPHHRHGIPGGGSETAVHRCRSLSDREVVRPAEVSVGNERNRQRDIPCGYEGRARLGHGLEMDPQRRPHAQDAGRASGQGRPCVPDRRHSWPDPGQASRRPD